MPEIERKVISYVSKSVKELFKEESSSLWTKRIKKTLVNLGHQFKFRVRAAPERELKADSGEWLYDLCWIKEGKNPINFKGLKLIAEMEWLNDEKDILRDFQKLTVGKADHRLMIVYYNEKGKKYNKKWLEGIIRKCKKLCPKQNFRYLLMGVPHWNEKNMIKEFWVK